MTNQEKFEAFKKQTLQDNEEKYGNEIRDKYGDDEVNASNQKLLNMTENEWDDFQSLDAEICSRLKEGVLSGMKPEDDAAKIIVLLHKKWLCKTWKQYTCEAHKGVASLYTADERFTAYYDKEGKAYTDPNEVVIYGKDGEVYTPVFETDVLDGIFSGENEYEYLSYYADNDGNKYDIYLCYVDEEGYFYFDEDEEIFYDEANYEEYFGDSEDYIDEETYRYYYDRYIDYDGNIFYWAEEVSWNEKGEIITAENDPNPPVIKKAE